jgi:uncharacterized membrane protein (UPF0127 family)
MLINARTREVIGTVVEVADTRATRRRGLLGREGLVRSHALMLSPCCSIHTAFMRFPIDVVFVDREGVAVRVVRDLGPWRMAVAARARIVFEFAGGTLGDVTPGDRLYLARPPDAAAPEADTASKRSLAAGR